MQWHQTAVYVEKLSRAFVWKDKGGLDKIWAKESDSLWLFFNN